MNSPPPGLQNNGLYLGQAYGAPQSNNDDTGVKQNFVNGRMIFGTAGYTDFWTSVFVEPL
jgi:hypothetical protein